MYDSNWGMIDVLSQLAGEKSPAQIEREISDAENKGIHSDGSVERYLGVYQSEIEVYAEIKVKERPEVRPDEIIKVLWNCPIKKREELYQTTK